MPAAVIATLSDVPWPGMLQLTGISMAPKPCTPRSVLSLDVLVQDPDYQRLIPSGPRPGKV